MAAGKARKGRRAGSWLDTFSSTQEAESKHEVGKDYKASNPATRDILALVRLHFINVA